MCSKLTIHGSRFGATVHFVQLLERSKNAIPAA
jgi:hypothetical protein